MQSTFEQRAYRLARNGRTTTLPQGDGAPAPPISPQSVLFDFDPAWSMTEDRAGGITLAAGGTNPVTRAVHNGRLAAVFDGTNYLLGDSPFPQLSSLSGGCTIYAVCERTDALNTQKSVVNLDQAAGAGGQQVMYLAQGNTDAVVGGMADTGSIVFDSEAAGGGRNFVRVISADYDLTEITARNSSYGSASSVSSRDPSGLDRVSIGGTLIFGLGGDWVGRIYRVLICEGAFSQAIADYLANLYTPLRLPPMVSASDVAFLWDPRHNPYRDTLNGISLTPTSAPSRISRAGDVSMYFDGTDDELSGPIGIGTLSGEWTLYLVSEPEGSDYEYFFGVEDEGNALNESLFFGPRETVGPAGGIRAGGTQQVNTNATGSVVGEIELGTLAVATSTVQALRNGVGTSTSVRSLDPTGIDKVTLGSAIGAVIKGQGYVYFALLVNASRSEAAEAWLTANFPVGVSP